MCLLADQYPILSAWPNFPREKSLFLALQQLASNQHAQDFPISYKSAFNGYYIEECQKFNSDANRKKMRMSAWKSLQDVENESYFYRKITSFFKD